MVTSIFLCPNLRCTYFSGAPFSTNMVACVCRKLWKLVFEAYVESLAPLSQWVYRGSEDEAQDYFWITECTISKEVFEEMESDAWSYSDESVLSFEEEETEEARESAYIKTIVEEYIRQRAFNAERNSISLSDDEFETVFERYVC